MGGRRGAWAVLADAVDATGRPGGLKQAWSILRENKLQHLVVGFLVVGFLLLVLITRVLFWANLDSLQWNALLTATALILNIMLCSFHLVVIVNLWEFSKASAAAPRLLRTCPPRSAARRTSLDLSDLGPSPLPCQSRSDWTRGMLLCRTT
jgi:hypothetical protein